jgi:hypothetical protein
MLLDEREVQPGGTELRFCWPTYWPFDPKATPNCYVHYLKVHIGVESARQGALPHSW